MTTNPQTPTSPRDLTRLMRELRTGFNQMKALADTLGADLGVTASMRAVMEGLNKGGGDGRTVPALARERGVSRQHIQVVVNTLLERGLVRALDNPGHKRSPLYVLTGEGHDLADALHDREATPLSALAAQLPASETATACALLQRLNAALAAELARRAG